MEPSVKLLMRYKRPWLQELARKYNIHPCQAKIELAEQIAKAQQKQSEKDWTAISGGNHEV